MNAKLALLSAALLAFSPMAIAQDDTGNTGADVGSTTGADTSISGSGDADTQDQHGETLADDGTISDTSPAAGADYFDEWDTDRDGSLSEDEFNMGFDQYRMDNQ